MEVPAVWDRKRRRRPKSSTQSLQRRGLQHERLEPRCLMAASPIHVGLVYLETDYLESDADVGSDSRGDRFILSFTGGAAGTELRELRIRTDKDGDGISVGDPIFDTAPGGRGKGGSHAFQVVRHQAGTDFTATATVEDGGQELIIRFTGFHAGDRLEFTLDVDEITRNSPDLAFFNSRLDVITSGQEFQDSILQATFDAPHYETAHAEALFLNDFGDPASAVGLDLPADDGDDIDSRPNRSAAAVGSTGQVPKPISIAGTVWIDDDLDLAREAGEAGIAGVQLSLWRRNEATGQFVDTGRKTVTNAAGQYKFATDLGLAPGTYRIVQSQPAGYYSVGAVAGTVDAIAVGSTAGHDVLTGIDLLKGDLHAVNYDFAEARPAGVSGYVYRDDSDDGIRGAGEPGIAGVRVRLIPVGTIAPETQRTATTAADGSYRFDGLSPGRYRIVQLDQPTDLSDGLDTAGTVNGVIVGSATNPGDAISGIVLAGAQQGVEYNFGELPLGSLAGFVYLVAPGEDCDGPHDGRDKPLPGVRIVLQDAAGNTIAETTTGNDGGYTFGDLPKGVYTILEFTPGGLLDGTAHAGRIGGVTIGDATGGGRVQDIRLPAGGSGLRYDFCEAAPAHISGHVYHDASDDGRRDAGEEPIPGATVELVADDGRVAARATTNAEGRYQFVDVLPGVYTIRQLQPAGFFDGKDRAGTVDGSITGDAQNPGDAIRSIALRQGQTGIDFNFGELRPASLAGRVHADIDGDCELDPGEQTLSGVVMRLLDAAGREVARTQTGPDGRYRFDALKPDEYSVVQEQPVGYYDGGRKAGSAGGDASVTNRIGKIVLASGEVAVDYDFCEHPPAQLAGVVFADRNGDCLVDAGEPGIAGTLVELLDTNGRVVASTTTDASGRYLFTNLRAGRYTVRETQPVGYLQGGQMAGSAGGDASQPDLIADVPVAWGSRLTDYNFCELEPSSIAGTVFVDADGSASYGPGERLLPGVRVVLEDASGTAFAETVTDANGDYEFTNLRPGEYRVREFQPDGWYHGGQIVGSGGGAVLGPDLLGRIQIGPGQTLVDYDFFELEPSSIAGTVFVDDNGDARYSNGERLLSGVRIQLQDAAGAVVAETVTDARGDYRFAGLRAGEYRIREFQPQGWYHGGQTAGSGGGNVLGDDLLGRIQIDPGQSLVDYDFFELEPSSIAGTVFVDDNGDAGYSNGERLLSGVRIQLQDAAGAVVAETVTDARGDYQFTGLRAGEYRIREFQPQGWYHGGQTVGSGGGNVLGDDLLGRIPVGPGQTLVDYDFYEWQPGTLAGSVFIDGDGDCLFDAGEQPLQHVRVQLLDSDGAVVAETQTDAAGAYRFTHLQPGQYRIREIQPAGWYQGGQRLGSGGGVILGEDLMGQIQVGPGQNLVDYNFCELPGGSLAGRVWQESDLNGRHDAGEQPIAGVLIELLDVAGAVIRQTRTTAAGTYVFSDLAPGVYGIREAQPDGVFHGGQVVGSIGGNVGGQDLLTTIQVGGGVQGVGYDFYEVPPATIAGFVFQDGPALQADAAPSPADLRQYRDGVRNSSSRMLAGVTLELRNVLGQPFTADRALPGVYGDGPIRVVTRGDGYYEFAGLRPGTYHVYQVQPDGYVDGLDTAGSTGGFAVNAADQTDDPQLQFVIQTLSASAETDPADDAILNINLGAGQRSIENNFSEIVITAPPLPPPPAPPLAPPVETPHVPIETFPGVTRVATFAVPTGYRQPLFADGEFQVSWHLSVINGGHPRGEGIDGPPQAIIRPASSTQTETWREGKFSGGRWHLVTGDGQRMELSDDLSLGADGAVPLAGDFNGDGRDEVAIFVGGQWYVDLNGNGRWDAGDLWIELGTELDRPVVGDWDGDGKDDVGIFGPQWSRDREAIVHEPGLPDPENRRRARPKNQPPSEPEAAEGRRLLQQGASGALREDLIDHVFRYGQHPDVPVAGDWNGDGIDAIAVFRAGQWRLDSDGDGRWTHRDQRVQFGQPGDVPVAGDWNGDGVDDLGVVRDDLWIIDSDGNRRLTADDQRILLPRQSKADLPVAGDWDGDGRDQPGNYSPPAKGQPSPSADDAASDDGAAEQPAA